MKKILIIVSIFMLSFIYESYSHITIKTNTIQYWAYWNSVINKCLPFGTNCLVIIQYPIIASSATLQTNGSYNIEIEFSGNINQAHSPTGQQTVNFSIPSSNYQFGAGEILTIEECTDYPELNGRQLNLTGLTINPQGILNITIQ